MDGENKHIKVTMVWIEGQAVPARPLQNLNLLISRCTPKPGDNRVEPFVARTVGFQKVVTKDMLGEGHKRDGSVTARS